MDIKISPEIVEEKKKKYLKAKETLAVYLKELLKILEDIGDSPLSDKKRKIFMGKFSMVDHRLLDKFDIRSYEYFEAKDFLKRIKK